jgi:CDP-glucose 4,6-dehydratase
MNFEAVFKNRRILVTGHTGFKGAWLCEWLLSLGAEVTGLALPPETEPNLFHQLGLAGRMDARVGDIRDADRARRTVRDARPDFVFHLAAQPLVRLSYKIPVETFATNVMGTVHVLDALKELDHPCAAVLITTDKCYENREWLHAYREEDPMGGYDPYSASKGACEIAIAAYRRSFFSDPRKGVLVASARAGNVIGGGDWAVDRIVPDCIRALKEGRTIPVRNKIATRPWQHVLEPLGGYLALAARLGSFIGLANAADAPGLGPMDFASAFNFGPPLASNRTVADLVSEVLLHWPGSWEDRSDPNAPHEASKLNLATDKAFHLLDWQPRWDFARTIRETVSWYKAVEEGGDPLKLTRQQIAAYSDVL